MMPARLPEVHRHRKPIRRSIARRLNRLDRIVSAVTYVVGVIAILLMFVIAFVPWSLCWFWSGACP